MPTLPDEVPVVNQCSSGPEHAANDRMGTSRGPDPLDVALASRGIRVCVTMHGELPHRTTTKRPDSLVARFRIARTKRESARPRRGRSQLVLSGRPTLDWPDARNCAESGSHHERMARPGREPGPPRFSVVGMGFGWVRVGSVKGCKSR